MNGQDPTKPKNLPGNPFATTQASTNDLPNNPFAQATSAPPVPTLSDSDVQDLLAKGADQADIERILAVQRGGANPIDAETTRQNENLVNAHPAFGLLPDFAKSLITGVGAGGAEVLHGAASFFSKFVNGSPDVSQLRHDLANWDTPGYEVHPDYSEAGITPTSPQQLYGSKENLTRLLHASIVARNEGRELTKGDVAMVSVPLYALPSMLASAGERLTDAPSELAGPGNISTRIHNFAQALSSGVFQVALLGLGSQEGAKVALKRMSRIGSIESGVPISTVEGGVELGNNVASANTWAAIQERLKNGPSPELDQLKSQMMNEDRIASISTIVNAHRNLRPEDITIVPGVERFGAVMKSVHESGVNEDNVAVHKNSDGTYDVALFGNDSPLADPTNRTQFGTEGWFNGQEAAYKGQPVAYLGRSIRDYPGKANVQDLNTGTKFQVSRDELRRLPFSSSGTVSTELVTGHIPRDPFDVLKETVNKTPQTIVEAAKFNNETPVYTGMLEQVQNIFRDLAGDKTNVNEVTRKITSKVDDLIDAVRNLNADDINSKALKLGRDYRASIYDLPLFNKSQIDLREIASDIGQADFGSALKYLKSFKSELGKTTEEVSRYVSDVHKPAKIRNFTTDKLFDEYFTGISGQDPHKGGLTVLGAYNPSVNEIIMRPAESIKKISVSGRTYEKVLSHEVAHAFGDRVIEFNRSMAEKILQAARDGNTNLVNQETIDYIRMIDAAKAEGRQVYVGKDDVLKEAVTEELSHRYPVTPLKEMFQSYQTELKKSNINEIYNDFKAFHKSVMESPHTWESPIQGNLSFPDISNLQKSPLAEAINSARKYFTAGEILSEFQRVVTENKLDDLVTPEVIEQVKAYAQTVEKFDLVQSFDRQVSHFADLRGIPRAYIDGFKNFIGQKWSNELRELHLTPDELDQFNTLRSRLEVERGNDVSSLEVVSAMDQLPLSMEAASNGYRVQFDLNGGLTLTNGKPGESYRFSSTDAARSFINKSGQVDTPNVTRDTNIPQQVGGAAMPPSGAKPPNTLGPNDGLNAAYDASDKATFDKGFLGKLLDVKRSTADWITTRQASFESVDNLHQTKFGPIADRLRAAWSKYAANATLFAKQYLDDIGKMMKGLSKEKFANIFRYIEAKSPSELTSDMLARGHNEAIDIAHGLSELRTDTSKALEFARKRNAIVEDMKGKSPNEISLEVGKLIQAMGMDQNGVLAGGILSGLRNRDINVVPIHEIVRLSDALMWDAPDRATFAKMSNMSPKEILIAKRFDNFFEEAAKVAGIPDYRKISGYIAHIRSQIGRDLPSSEASVLFQKGLGNTMEGTFVNEYVRTGEMSAIDLNPYTVALRYIDSAFKARDFAPTYRQSLKEFDTELGNLKRNQTGKWITNEMVDRVKRFMSDLRGYPAPANAMLRAGIESLNQAFKTNWSPQFIDTFATSMMKIFSSSLIAFRPYLGLRHLAQFIQFAGARFGNSAMWDGMRLAEKPGAIDALKASGALSGLDYMSLVTPEEAATSLLVKHGGNAWKAYEALAKVGHEASLLPTIYEHTYAATYLGLQKLALDNLGKLATGKLSKLDAYNNISLDSFAPSFRLEFDRLVSNGKIEEAAALIAKRGAKETIFDYQGANAPRGWNSVQGRFLTMFGIWPTYASELVSNMLTRGTVRHRVNYAARFAMGQAAVYLAGRATGLDLVGATVAHSYLWTGSPQLNMLQTTITALNGNGVEQKLAQDRLFRLVPFLKTTTQFGERRFQFDFDPLTADPRSMFVPGSYALGDWMQAIQESKDPWGRYTNTQKIGRGLGIPTIKHKSWIDDYLEKYGLQNFNYKTTVDQQ